MRARLLKTAALTLSTGLLGACGAAYSGAPSDSAASVARSTPQPEYAPAPMAPRRA